ncbi:HTH-type transcriptional regulator IscR [Aliarcobacter thereius]|uniref:HTH-type transcriptional regulator IscR n=2 Tax=Aliarcobacter thereius TaxID=544718 RepID=A0A1C0B860_9BACT|nr:Rrf2 family transcriptional regulator [Aliarcobacter thereius]OCL87689.1 HTH-type transcriptional regulator IscR [Aliarcobacter thereius]OCL93945.1 HTH-type transcriptional regulator IscR [Aliarcobacter thereius]OCL95340.1 HTH-type transcriptional regulator IscR [Aliarcobacter thereius LMG 24486]OCL99767.1 HTH-type transcriptional regulator IscR [Aliarcobacter thereius]QBF16671.1 transcriptional regulator, IscR/Rrf2 family [Aliarcobacter thereius LMG 24486]
MLLTKKSEYALLSLISISKHEEPINVDQLSKELEISKSFLAKIMQNLAKEGLVVSHRGVNGGFTLNKPIDELTILEIVVAAEERTPMVFECSDSISSCPNNKAKLCNIWPFLNNLQFKVNDFLSQLTLKDIIS